MERRLVAILAADVVGYSRLMEQDEAGTFARLRAHRKDLFEPEIARHHGQIFKLMGDGLLAEFASVVDAAECAVMLQRSMIERNTTIPENRRIVVRIGVNLGDVIVEDNDRYGDGVNIAARLQELAEAGGIVISGTAYDQVEKKLDVGYEFLGEQRVKNIDKPVRVYRLRMDPAAAGKTFGARQAHARSLIWPVVVAGTLAAIVVAGAAVWWQPWEPRIAPASVERMALPLPDKPSIAVLPFTNMSADPEQEYFANGLTEDLITDLSQVSALFVISRNSTFAYKDKSADARQIARELGVRYLLEGSVQRSGESVRINAQLIDGLSGGHLWADRYDGLIADVFQLQNKVTRSITDALALRLTAEELQSIGSAETDSPEAYDAFLRGWQHFRRGTPQDFGEAIPYFQRATKLDPEYWRAYAALALVHWSLNAGNWYKRAGVDEISLLDVDKYLAMTEGHPTSTSYQVIGNMATIFGESQRAGAAFQEAIALDPSDSWSYAYMSRFLTLAGQPVEAKKYIQTAMRIDPRYPPVFGFYLGFAQFSLEQFDDAAASLERATQTNPDDEFGFLFLGATYGYLGRKQEAAAAIATFNTLYSAEGRPPMTARFAWYLLAYVQRADRDRLLKGLVLAGVPELMSKSQ